MKLPSPDFNMHSTDRANAAVSPPAALSALDAELRNVLRQLRTLEQLTSENSHGRLALSDQLQTAILDPILDRLAELGHRIAGKESASYADMTTKALAIESLIEERSDDLIHRLAASLAKDVLARAAAEDED